MAEMYLVEDDDRERRAMRLLAQMPFLADGLYASRIILTLDPMGATLAP
jgi:hypothetical protein